VPTSRVQGLRRQLNNEFDEALIPAGEKGLCQYIIIGTVLHDDSQLAKLLMADQYPEFHKLFYKARQDDNTSLWPEKWSLDYLKELEMEKPAVFAKEYQNDPVSGQNVRFSRTDFRYWRTEGNDYVLLDSDNQPVARGALSTCKAAIACDLSWSERREADYGVLLPGLLTPQAEVLILPYIARRGMKPDYIASTLFSMEDRLRSMTGSLVPIGFEKAMLENVTKWILKNEMRERNHYLHVKELAWGTDKIARIETRLQPRYAQHVMFHQKGMGDLENHLERFPYAAHDDIPDALQGLIQLLKIPKGAAKLAEPDDQFMTMRQFMLDSKQASPSGLFSINHTEDKIPDKYKTIHSPLPLKR